MIKKTLFFFISLIPQNSLKIFLLNLIPNIFIDKKSKIGLAIIFDAEKIKIINSKIGNLNYFNCKYFRISNSKISNNNIFNNLYRFKAENKSIIGSHNIISGLRNNIKVYLKMNNSQISSNFRLHLSKNLYLGQKVILGGVNTKIIAQVKKDILKNTILYKNIFVGSNVVIKNGTRINKDIIIGANTLVDKNIYQSGKYFSKRIEIF
jgi:acetyltransferase-like isoleucine patch superfamily enzyme